MTKRYFEVVASAATTMNNPAFGIGLASANLSSALGSTTASFGYYKTGVLLHNNTTAGTGSTFGVGDVIGILVDYMPGEIYIYKNNTLSVSYTPGIPAGDWYPMAILEEGDTATANFSMEDWIYTPAGAYGYDNIEYGAGGPNYAESWDTWGMYGMAVSGINSTATVTATTGAIGGLMGRTTGQYYFKLVPQTYPSASMRFGFLAGPPGEPFDENLGDTSTPGVAMRWDGTNGYVWSNSTIQGYIYFSTADPFDFYIDMTAGTYRVENAYGGVDGTFTPGSEVWPIFAGELNDSCVLYVTNADLDAAHINASYSSYLAWHNGL